MPGKSQGLYDIEHTTTQRLGNYQFTSAPLAGSTKCESLNAEGRKPCDLSFTGQLAPIGGIGAACNRMYAHSGAGMVVLENGTSYALSGITWHRQAGAIAPIRGTYDLVSTSETKPSKQENDSRRIGPFLGTLTFAPNAACHVPPPAAGSASFSVIGEFKFDVTA